jgi:hypothetical protein
VNESVSSLLKQKIKKEKAARFIPENYFYVTHVTNPAKFFWEQKRRDVEKTDKVSRKLMLGKQLEKKAGVWFRNLPEFFLEEGKLDGAWVGIPGVRGSIDYRIGDSIIEFKTKNDLPENADTVIEKYPQDLEQLSFYSILHPDFPECNYLVFMNNAPPYKLKAFRVRILNRGGLKTLLLGRISNLKKAIETDDCSKLGQCRYYGSGCEYEENHACECHMHEPLSTESLKKAVEVSFDETFTNQLEAARKGSLGNDFSFSIRDVIAPRKFYLSEKTDFKEAWKGDTDNEEYLAFLSNMIRKLSLCPSQEELKLISSQMKEPRLRIARKWLKLKSSSQENGEIVPYLVKVGKAKDIKLTKRPGKYHLSELGIICASYGKPKGMIFTVYPELDNYIQVHEVIYNNPDGIMKFVKATLDNLEKAIKADDISIIPPCPDFMNNDKKCPLTVKCNGENIRGCVEKPA